MGIVLDAWQAAMNAMPEDAKINMQVEKSTNSAIYAVQMNDVSYSFRRVGDKHSIIFNGKSELIDKDVYDGFIGKANTYLAAIGKLPS